MQVQQTVSAFHLRAQRNAFRVADLGTLVPSCRVSPEDDTFALWRARCFLGIRAQVEQSLAGSEGK